LTLSKSVFLTYFDNFLRRRPSYSYVRVKVIKVGNFWRRFICSWFVSCGVASTKKKPVMPKKKKRTPPPTGVRFVDS
jgi:hypothetical protein